ncbi:MAG TPA: hypothetical protein VLV48_04070, partial [Thermoanaerobaculia bacterium]|nr:hypothetical protein [Thermoanaerobaculia bacterium]
MRTAILILLALLIALGAALVIPLFSEPAAPRLADRKDLLAMMGEAPADAETVIAIPTFAPAWRRFSPLIAPLLKSEVDARSLDAASWMVGSAPVAIWTGEGGWGAVARPDAVHRLLLRAAIPFISIDVAVEGPRVRFGSLGSADPRPPDPALAESLAGHLFVVHGEDGSYPPMGRPALSAVRFGEGALQIVTRARVEPGAAVDPVRIGAGSLPSNALLAARFAEPPPAVLAMAKTSPMRFERLLRDGGLVALYGVDDGGLVTRPLIAFSVPADEEGYREMVAAVDRAMARGAVGLLLGPQPEAARTVAGVTIHHREGLGLTLEFARRGDEMLFSFDDESLERLLQAEMVPARNGAASWTLRARPRELLPALEEIGSSRGLRLLARGFSDSARDLARALR